MFTLLIVSCENGTIRKSPSPKVPVITYSVKDHNVSIIKLISTPEKYNGKEIEVRGFLNLEFEGTAIFLHKEDSEKFLSENGVWLELSRKFIMKLESSGMNQKYVRVRGIFDFNNRGHESAYSGGIRNITLIKALN